jgi:hypothetical protein
MDVDEEEAEAAEEPEIKSTPHNEAMTTEAAAANRDDFEQILLMIFFFRKSIT